jgi:hypothetical protein
MPVKTVMKIPLFVFTTLALIAITSCSVVAQKEKAVPVCKESTFAAVKPLPKMEYECPEAPNDSDEKILKLPARLAALRGIEKELTGFSNAAWWQAGTDELNACGIHGSAGELTDDEKERWKQGDYNLNLMGNHDMRLLLLDDPCYQTGFAGSNAFLLYRKDGKVIVSQVLNGYYSRVDNSVGLDFATLNGQQIIEVSTANSMPPSMVYYYFAVDPVTNKAVPKKIFKEGKKFTNQIYSDMLLADPKDAGLPASASELNVIVKGKLAPSFSAYDENENGRIEASGRKFHRIIYRWNGRFYSPR